MTSWRPDLVALDVDGTIIGSEGVISPAVRAAIDRVLAAGAHVVLSTGRTALGLRSVLDELALSNGVALCSNGAVRLELTTGVLTELATFDPKPVVQLLRKLIPGGEFSMEEPGRGNRVSSGYPKWSLTGTNREVDELELVGSPTTRLVAHWAGMTQLELAEVLLEHQLPEVTWTLDHGQDAWLTVVGEGISKASALEQVRVELGVSPLDTIAFGDGHNDIAMLRWAARGVAMGNASEEVRAAADEVTATVAEDGVARVLDQLFPEPGGTV